MSTAPLQPHGEEDDGPITGPLRPGGRGAIPFSRRDDVEAIRRDMMEGEQIYGTFGDGTGDISLLGITNRRLIFVNVTIGDDDRVGLTSVPLRQIVSCSYVTHTDAPLTEATAVSIQIGRTFYEMGCTDTDEARDVYGLIMWHLIGL